MGEKKGSGAVWFLVLEQLRHKEAPGSPGKKCRGATDNGGGASPCTAGVPQADGEGGLRIRLPPSSLDNRLHSVLNGVVIGAFRGRDRQAERPFDRPPSPMEHDAHQPADPLLLRLER